MDVREVNINYGRMAVIIRHDSAEIWGFRYGVTLGISTLKIMAGTGVFVRVGLSHSYSTSCDPQTPRIILTLIKHKQSHSHQKICPERDFYEGRKRTKQIERQPRIVVYLIKLIPR
jgi:hypothetical protein